MNTNRNVSWRDKLDVGINKNNLNSSGAKPKPLSVPPVLSDLPDMNQNNRPIPEYINYTSHAKSNALQSNFNDPKNYDKFDDMFKKIMDELTKLNGRYDLMEKSINNIREHIMAMSNGDVLFDGDLKLGSKIRKPDDIEEKDDESDDDSSDDELDNAKYVCSEGLCVLADTDKMYC